jgi:ParB-like chromosome segregation protein Spo0J
LNAQPVPIERLRPFPRQVRRYPATQIRKLAKSVDTFGFVLPIVIDEKERVVGGWALVLAAKKLALAEIPAITVADLSELELRALRVALNRLSEDGAWDRQELAFELKELFDLGFEIDLTGFEIAEIDLLIEEHRGDRGEDQDREDAVVDPNRDRPAVTKPGDIWRLGDHLLLCGDAQDPESYAALLREETSRLIFTDPPYITGMPPASVASDMGTSLWRRARCRKTTTPSSYNPL